MRRYDLKTTDEKILWQKTAEDVADLFEQRKIDQETMCRMTGLKEWHELNEFFPALKYKSVVVAAKGSEVGSNRLAVDDRGERAKTSALVAGWICFGLGVAIAWIFPAGNFFYSIAIILAIICMATHQVNRGLTLLLTTCVCMGISAIIFFWVVVGTMAAAITPALQEAKKSIERAEDSAHQQAQALSRAATQLGQAPAFRTSPVVQTPVERERPLDQWSGPELISEITRLERIQREAPKSGRAVPAEVPRRILEVQAAYDRVTASPAR